IVGSLGVIRAIRGEARFPSGGYLYFWMFVLVLASLCGVLALAGNVWLVAPLLGCAVLLAPWTVARCLLVPLGMSRAARALGQIAGWAWGKDLAGGGLVAGAWALLRRAVPDREVLERLERARDEAPALTAAHV